MPDLTKNYGLKKPLANEYAKPDDFNYNADIIDEQLKKLDDEKASGEHTHLAQYIFSVNTQWDIDGANGGYYKTISIEGINATDNPIADVVLGTDIDANTLYLDSWSCITRITTTENAVTLWANKSAPTTAFTLQLQVVR